MKRKNSTREQWTAHLSERTCFFLLYGMFVREVLDRTGWDRVTMPHKNASRGELDFAKMEVENLQKLLTPNGDIEFMDAVRQRYHGYLSYLNG
eukprot:CAMPEP_0181077308 /NCGR_PEP_ID=MMETSP1071-20121207/883_1 /TAXON_ID=35127 /ORGANISM="Thalassiosira sp., Strain NH16" /LENGTH=92 /DNA_ID=CAMNT_0023158547 /DNA_START=1 /DNA_END=279 /DNA_ORIENTATION=-